MLSRVAERLYWMGRYLERVENLSRLINVNATLLLDLPTGTGVGWQTLIDIAGANEEFAKKNANADEQAITRFLIADQQAHCSLLSCLRYGRENARTAREIIPAEVWELINDTYLYVKESASRSTSRAGRSKLLRTVIERAQLASGMLNGTMSHTSAYDFIRMGSLVERADMTTRIVEVGAINFSQLQRQQSQSVKNDEFADPLSGILWMSVLQSLSAYQMYRQHVLNRVTGVDVVNFLLKDEDFPRAVSCCLLNLRDCLLDLPRNDDILRTLAAVQRRVDAVNVANMLASNDLSGFIDTLQMDIGSIHNEIARTWFLPNLAAG